MSVPSNMTTPGTTWELLNAGELVEALDEQRLDELLEKRSAIYVWKKTLQDSRRILADGQSLIDWIDHLLSTPHSIVNDKHISPHIHFRSIELKSQPATAHARQILRHWAADRKNRHWLNAYLRSLSQHTPALYVGETGNLQRRIAEHLRGQTDFGALVEERLSWNFLDLYYFDLGNEGPEDSQLRKAIEYITNSITFAGYTKRPG